MVAEPRRGLARVVLSVLGRADAGAAVGIVSVVPLAASRDEVGRG